VSLTPESIRWFPDSIRMLPGVHLPTRTVALRHPDGVVVVSPSPNIREVANEIRAMGEVTDLVAPNLFHHLGVATAREVFPEATLWGVPGFAQAKPELPWDRVLTEADWPYQESLPFIYVDGAKKLSEAVFLEPASSTLVLQDLVFNLLDDMSFVTSIPFRLFGTHKRFAVSKMIKKTVDDETAFRASLSHILSLPFENLLMAHGRPVEGSASGRLRAAFAERGFDP